MSNVGKAIVTARTNDDGGWIADPVHDSRTQLHQAMTIAARATGVKRL
jgi:hypothetical protein